jgi:putative mRNA 3-end processing factor
MVIAPSAAGSPWMKRFGDYSDAFASGWMLLRGARRRRGVDRGFVLSDHADWPGLMQAITATQAERIIVTHGSIPCAGALLAAAGPAGGRLRDRIWRRRGR